MKEAEYYDLDDIENDIMKRLDNVGDKYDRVVDTLMEALLIISDGNPQALKVWTMVNEELIDPAIKVKFDEGYKPTWHGAAEYRGALVAIYRIIARDALLAIEELR